jgi:hypothetical protein
MLFQSAMTLNVATLKYKSKSYLDLIRLKKRYRI